MTEDFLTEVFLRCAVYMQIGRLEEGQIASLKVA